MAGRRPEGLFRPHKAERITLGHKTVGQLIDELKNRGGIFNEGTLADVDRDVIVKNMGPDIAEFDHRGHPDLLRITTSEYYKGYFNLTRSCKDLSPLYYEIIMIF